MGSQQPLIPDAAPQQELLPVVVTRKAACPYFSLTTSLIFADCIMALLFADLNDGLRFYGLITRAAFGIEKAEQLLQDLGVRPVAKEGSLPLYGDQILVLELVEMMRQRGIRDIEFSLDFVYDHAVGISRQEHLHDAETGFGTDRGKHVGKAGNLFGIDCVWHVSIVAEIWILCQVN